MKEQLQELFVTKICEGKATIELPQNQETVFYNRVQEFNRDLSVAVLQLFEKIFREEQQQQAKFKKLCRPQGLSILEAFSASGLRAIRYAKEIEGIHQVIANDHSPLAVEMIRKGVLENGLSLEQVIPHQGDAK
jgi:tRNA (guanine26-N2/guanine27-N2)-dimethyltransferase